MSSNIPSGVLEREFALICSFVAPCRRDRVKQQFMSARSRKKFLSKLGHFDGFDDGSVIEIASHNQHLSSVLDSLRGHGAPEQCYVISENPKLNAKEMILSDALANTIGMGFGTIIVCLAGRLAFFEGECQRRVILKRPVKLIDRA